MWRFLEEGTPRVAESASCCFVRASLGIATCDGLVLEGPMRKRGAIERAPEAVILVPTGIFGAGPLEVLGGRPMACLAGNPKLGNISVKFEIA